MFPKNNVRARPPSLPLQFNLLDPKDSVEAQHVIRFEDKHTTASSSLKDLCDTTNIGAETVILKSLSSLLQFYSESSIACWLKALQTGCKARVYILT